MSNNGWIKLHRKIVDNPLWNKKPFSEGQAWIDLLLAANHEPKDLMIGGQKTLIDRGQFHTSELKLAERWGWSRKQVRAFLRSTLGTTMVTTIGTAMGTTVTIENYASYQDEGTTKGTAMGTTIGTQTRRKEEKNINTCSFDSFWIAYPRKQGKIDAVKAWGKLNPDPDITSKIIEAVNRYKATDAWQKDGGQYIPLPASFIRGRRWEDEISIAKQQTNDDPYRDSFFSGGQL